MPHGRWHCASERLLVNEPHRTCRTRPSHRGATPGALRRQPAELLSLSCSSPSGAQVPCFESTSSFSGNLPSLPRGERCPVGTSAPFTVLAGMGPLSGLLYAKPLAELTGVAFLHLDASASPLPSLAATFKPCRKATSPSRL